MSEISGKLCKSCGANLDLSAVINNTVKCSYCQNVYTLPKKETNPAALIFIRQGEHDLDTGKFGDAYTAFKKAADLDEAEPEAYWGMALAEFKVQYLNDEKKKHMQPICSEITANKFTKNKNFVKALELATDEQKEVYKERGEEIDYIREEFFKLKKSGTDYDCFICVKVTDDETGEKTSDCKTADYIYNLLQNQGYTPFFSERVVFNRTGADYEAMILYALYTSETMLVVCSNEEYLRTDWVRNEYKRFLKLVNDEEKESDSITIIFNGAPIEKLEGKNGKIQGIDFSRRDADIKILKFVEEHTPQFRAKKQEEKRKKEEEEKALRLKLEAQQKAQQELENKLNSLNFEDKNEELRRQIEEQKKAQRLLEEKLQNLNPNSATGAVSTISSLLTRVNQEMESRNFDKAKSLCETVLERAPENGEAWWKLVLSDYKATGSYEIIKRLDFKFYKSISNNNNLKFALRYASGELKVTIENLLREVYSSERWWNLFLKEMNASDEEDIISNISVHTLKKIENSDNLGVAIENAQGKMRERINLFYNRIKNKVNGEVNGVLPQLKEKSKKSDSEVVKLNKQIEEYTRLTEQKIEKPAFPYISLGIFIPVIVGSFVSLFTSEYGIMFLAILSIAVLFFIIRLAFYRSKFNKFRNYQNNLSALEVCKNKLNIEIQKQNEILAEVDVWKNYVKALYSLEEKYFYNLDETLSA